MSAVARAVGEILYRKWGCDWPAGLSFSEPLGHYFSIGDGWWVDPNGELTPGPDAPEFVEEIVDTGLVVALCSHPAVDLDSYAVQGCLMGLIREKHPKAQLSTLPLSLHNAGDERWAVWLDPNLEAVVLDEKVGPAIGWAFVHVFGGGN